MRQSAALAARDHKGPLTSLALWPDSGLLLAKVPTAGGSLCAESLLYPSGLLPPGSPGWAAPEGCAKADLHIVLPRMASIMAVQLCPGSVPYGCDLPNVKV